MSELLDRLLRNLSEFCQDGIALGFSGGTDSALLLAVIAKLREQKPFPFAAVMMYSAFQSEQECAEAEELAKRSGVPFYCLEYDPLSIPEVRNNCLERCYFCKKYFFTKIREFAAEKNLFYVIDGTNADDLTKYRPGQKAIRELGVRSPLAECNFSKAEVRQLSRELWLSTAEKPASPCLATRFDYGMELTAEKIRKVAAGEEIIRKFVPQAAEIRLRIDGNTARIEVSSDQLPALQNCQAELFQELHSIGFKDITIDPRGYRSGSFDHFQTKKADKV
ncbi:MAG: ATP-dependent sacrificial sulfur transferase LarE [Lentisphaerae bacterium]|nr:ATP-dependent sacrificial sulfur transferase LarE [Lentisphaerota bacterium]